MQGRYPIFADFMREVCSGEERGYDISHDVCSVRCLEAHWLGLSCVQARAPSCVEFGLDGQVHDPTYGNAYHAHYALTGIPERKKVFKFHKQTHPWERCIRAGRYPV